MRQKKQLRKLRKILKIMDEQGWTVKGIITTHSNADHIGGNKIIQERSNCNIYAKLYWYIIRQDFLPKLWKFVDFNKKSIY